ncbi:MAG: oxidoreductase [Betaproteobacteria bacterium]|nr:oxidoreductase [Betaproteobacteria bacterium]
MTTAVNAANAGAIVLGDLKVNRLGFGSMRLCGDGAWGLPKNCAAALKLLQRAVELGIHFIDTADSYGSEVAETLIAEALYPYPAGVVIATQSGYTRPTKKNWIPNGRPEHLRKAVEESLKRLRLSCIDLYQLQIPDLHVPFADSVGALADLRRAGKIRHVGLASVTVGQIEEANAIVPIVSVQKYFNVEDHSHDDVLATCERMGIAFIPWYPLASGQLLRSPRLVKIANERRATAAQVALAWLLTRSPAMLPAPGTGRIAHLEENIGAADLKLSAEAMHLLGEPRE